MEDVSLALAIQFEGLLIFLRLHAEPKVMGAFAGIFAVAAVAAVTRIVILTVMQKQIARNIDITGLSDELKKANNRH